MPDPRPAPRRRTDPVGAPSSDVDALVRSRLRALRTSAGLSLDDVARRAHLSASTVSRIETGHRTLGLDVLVPLARALSVSLDDLLDTTTSDDVVIRPQPSRWDKATVWQLTRPGSPFAAIKMRIEPTRTRPEQRVHPGHDWLFVLSGRVELLLGERHIEIAAGEAAEFATMTPHAVAALGGPADVLMVLDPHGRTAHAEAR